MAECKNRDATALSEWREHGGTMPLDIILYALYQKYELWKINV